MGTEGNSGCTKSWALERVNADRPAWTALSSVPMSGNDGAAENEGTFSGGAEATGAVAPTVEKNSLAHRANVAASGSPSGASELSAATPSLVGVGVVMELADLDIIQQADGIIREHGQRAIQGNQI